MEYYIICRTGEESIRFVDEYWPDERWQYGVYNIR